MTIAQRATHLATEWRTGKATGVIDSVLAFGSPALVGALAGAVALTLEEDEATEFDDEGASWTFLAALAARTTTA